MHFMYLKQIINIHLRIISFFIQYILISDFNINLQVKKKNKDIICDNILYSKI